jgi:hypothetical protein
MTSFFPVGAPPFDNPEVPSDEGAEYNTNGEYHNIEIRHVAAIEKQQQQQQDGSVQYSQNDVKSNHQNVKKINDDVDNDNDDSSRSMTSWSRTFKLSLTSNMLFLVASFLYVLLAAYDLDYAYVQSSSTNSNGGGGGDDDDDAVAFGTVDDGLSTAAPTTDGYAAAAYATGDDNGSTQEVADDDYYLFATKNGVWVSKYQILYFVAALCFVVSGVVDFIQKQGSLLSVIFILAGCFGLVSAMLVEEYEYLSAVFDSVSAHLFMVEALGLFMYHRHIEVMIANGAAASASKHQQVLMSRVYCLLRLADGSFIAGTWMDVVLSYCYIRGTGESIPQGIVGVVAANLWLLCSLIYLMVTVITEFQVRKQHVDMSKAAANETSSDDSSASSPPPAFDNRVKHEHIP